MTSITFHGGVNDIGGNKFLVEDKGTKIFMDFGMSFTDEGKFFSQFMNARASNSLADYFALGILPKIPGLYRTDIAKHVGFDGDEPTDISGVLLTHAHVDHCKYISYLRPDIPIYCSEASKLIMQNYDETGNFDQYLTLKKKFQVYTNKKGEISKATSKQEGITVPREIKVFEEGKKFSIDSIEVEPLPVDHSIPGVNAFILHTSSGSIANTADLRFHGRREKDTAKFVERCGESSLDLILCEGTRIAETQSTTEYDVESIATKIINETQELVICGYPIRDLDRLMSFYLAAKSAGRYLVIDLKQAYLLKLFSSSTFFSKLYPSPTDETIKIFIPRGAWGLLDKDLEKFTERLLSMDYPEWQREFLDYPNKVDYRDVAKNQKEFVFYCSDFNLQNLIDVKPNPGSSYIRSLTEPFDTEMELKEEQIKNWFEHFGIIGKERDWHQVHVSGHGDGEQIKRVIDGANSKKLIPIHTHHDEYHKKWHSDVYTVNQHDKYELGS